MGILNRVVPKYIKTPDGKIVQQNVPEEVYIDDAFDPLFNKRAQEYLNYKYGNPFLGTLGGFAEGVDNALIGQDKRWGILGPGMGILSGFGRTMDKTGDFIIGGLTEGVNALNRISPIGADIKPENPLENIFVEDEDYTGRRLLAAMGNSMSKLAGDAVLDESDFAGAWNIAGTGLELATDPGILGGSLAKRLAPDVTKMSSKQILKNIGNAPVKHTVGEIGQLLSNYDDLMAKAAWDTTVPGLRPMLNNVLDKFFALTGNNVASGNQDVILKNYDNIDSSDISNSSNALQAGMAGVATLSALSDDTSKQTQQLALPSSPPTLEQITSDMTAISDASRKNLALFEKMLDDLAIKYNFNSSDPEIYEKFLKIKDNLNRYKGNQTHYMSNTRLDRQIEKYINEYETSFNDELSIALTGHPVRNKEFKTHRRQTKAGKRLTFGYDRKPRSDKRTTFVMDNAVSLEDLSYDYNVQSVINKLNRMDTDAIEGNIGPGYYFNLKYYEDPEGNLDYLSFLEDLENRTVKAESGEFVDKKILGYMENSLKRVLTNKGYVSSPVKVFHSPETRKNKAIEFAKYTNKKFKLYLKNHFGKEHVSADEFIKKFKESPYMQEFFKNDVLNKKYFKLMKENQELGILHRSDEAAKHALDFITVENTLEKQFDEAVKKFFNSDLIKKGEGTTIDYLNSFEEFIDFIYKNFSRTESALPNFKDITLGNSEFGLTNLINEYGYNETALQAIPLYRDLFDLGEAYNRNVIQPLTFKNKRIYAGPGETFSSNTLLEFNKILNKNPKAFLKPDGTADLEIIEEFRNATPSLNMQLSPDLKGHPFKPGEMDSLLDTLKDFLLNVKRQIADEKYVDYKTINPYNADFYKAIKNDPIKKGVITYSLNGAWKGKSPVNITIDEALKRIEIARKGEFYGDDLFRFMKNDRPEYTKIDSSFLVDSTLYKKRINEDFNTLYRNLANKTLAQEVVAPTTMNENIANNIVNKVIGNTENLDAVTGSVEETIKDFGTPEQKRLFGVFNDALAVHKKAKGGDYATLRMKPVEGLLEKSIKLKETVDEKRVAEYFRLKDLGNDDIITADNFISELTAANGRILIPLNKKTQSAKIKELTEVINHNIAATSIKEKPIIEIVTKDVSGTDYTILGYKLVQDANAPKTFSKLKFDSKSLKDLVIHKGQKVDLKGYEDLEELFLEAQGISEDLSTQLGFTSFSSDYFKHAMSDNVDAGEWLNKNIYNDIDIDDLENLSSVLSNIANNNGTFRIQPLSRSLRGNFADWNQFAPIFSTDLEAVMKSTFSKGVFDNVNFQSYVDLFINDNFKIKHYARTTEDLKEILYAGYDKGLTGNLNNTVLVAPVYNEAGKLIKFKRFDKFSEKGLTEALNNPDTILIPTNVLTPLDKILRKDAKMSSKVFQFINKYINIPFKFGTLMNPGFLVGNMGDAYFKQAVTLSSKYGTSLTEELANVSSSLKQVQLLNNKFDDIYRTVYLKKMFTQEQLEARPLLMMSDIVLKNKKAMQEFKDWFKTTIAKGELSKLDENTIRLWLFINEATPATFRASSELGNLPIDKTTYNIPRTTAERILTGDPSNELSSKSLKTNLKNIKQDWKTYGLFANNPLSAEIIKSSSAIEDYFRSACLLNDLKHQYEVTDIAKILHDYDFKEIGYTESMEALNIKMMEAVNTMYSANFNYDDMPDLMDGLSTFIPFPTFFMKNLGYWLKIAMERPELIDNLINVQTGLWGDRDLSEDEFQAEAAGRGAIPTSVTGLPDAANAVGGQKLSNLFKGIYKPSPMNSMFGAFNLLNSPVEDIAFRVNPALTPITRHLQDEESVRYRPYSTNQYERNITPKDENFNELALMFHRLNPMERTINTGLRTPGKLKKGEAQLSDFVPSIFQPDFSTKRSNKK